ncbi:hypothetical protein CVH13_00281 [Dehalococcoides mccartyi]|uniref:Uncharacterized protein n=1 Tax=Dehalococcoides mccartyi TaxID=61435 RepID=A0A2J1E031_9CHLR|nr:hypothetical protein CVH13_00281 [Dehalococcoides mccartyi]
MVVSTLSKRPILQTYPCTHCGRETEWDFDLGSNPLCAYCWDNSIEITVKVELADKMRARSAISI